jgi:hypothetical protein
MDPLLSFLLGFSIEVGCFGLFALLATVFWICILFDALLQEAGFYKKPTAMETLRTAWKKCTPKERAAFLKEIDADRA